MQVHRVVTSAIVAVAMVTGVAVSPAAAQEPEAAPGVRFEVDAEGGSATTSVVDPAGIEAVVVIGFNADAESDKGLELESIQVDAVVAGERIVETLVVEDFAHLGESDFTGTLRLASTGEVLHLDTTVVQAQALPVLYVLGLLARLGIKHVITWVGHTQLKRAVKSYLLNNADANKWGHILEAKHNWHLLGAGSREQVADLMGRAMAYGSHGPHRDAMRAVWTHDGRTITVTYDKMSGKVSNGWVN